MRVAFACFLALGLAGCPKQASKKQCMTMGGASELVSDAKLYRLDVYPDSVPCDGAEVAPGSVAISSHTFHPGEELKMDVAPGRRTLVFTTFSDDAGTIVTGSGCTTTQLDPGAQVCINLTIFAAPDVGVLNDLSASESGGGCSVSPDSCPAGQFCDGLMCQVGCKQSSDCVGMGPATDGGLPVVNCNPSSHQCVECTANAQCPLGKVCSPSSVCTIGCDAQHGCPGGLTCCNSFCVDTTSDVMNCGTCGNPCNVGGAITCCSSNCVDLNTNPDHCGSCARGCSRTGVATPLCAVGQCTSTCNFGLGNCTKPSSPNADDGCETDVTTPTNCGACNVKCADTLSGNSLGPATCRNVPDGGAATCQYTCNGNFKDCQNAAPNLNGCETNIKNDITNCGDCANICNTSNNTSTMCSNGSCTGMCKTNQADCSSASPNLDVCETFADTTTTCGSCTGCAATDTPIKQSATACTIPGGQTTYDCAYTCSCTPDKPCTVHNTGLTNTQVSPDLQRSSQHYYDCTALETSSWDQSHATSACIAWLGGPALGTAFCANYACTAGSMQAVCAVKNTGQPNQQCACWVWTGTNKGKAFIDATVDCSGCGSSGPAWN
jgi:hypothetical protein